MESVNFFVLFVPFVVNSYPVLASLLGTARGFR
jgi:hypothetical protein